MFGLSFSFEGFGALYACLSLFAWLLCALFAREYMARVKSRGVFYVFSLLALIGVLGVFVSADLFTLFLFYELMSLSSIVWVIFDQTDAAKSAAKTYLWVSVLSGILIFMGLALLYTDAHTFSIDGLAAFYDSKTAPVWAGICFLFGFGIKAGLFPFYFWLPQAHPVSPAPASALLSGILTKTGIYGIICVFCACFIEERSFGLVIILLAIATMLTGALLALFSDDLKRTLASSSVSQLGFIILGVGIYLYSGGENSVAIYGAAMHMVNHTLFKLLLFMAAGVVYMNLHTIDLNKIRGFGRGKPLFTILFSIGALGISGVPLFSGYISKTLLHEAAAELGLVTEIVFILTGGLTFAYMLKLTSVLFAKDVSVTKKHCLSPLSLTALVLPALLIAILGIAPNAVFRRLVLPAAKIFRTEVFLEKADYFSIESLAGAALSLLAGAAVYFGLIRPLVSKKRGYHDIFPAFEVFSSLLCGAVVDAVSAVFLFFDRIFDALAVFMSRTLFKWVCYRTHLGFDVKLAYVIGRFADRLLILWDFITGNHERQRESLAPKLAEAELSTSAAAKVVSASFSFSLVAACAGIIIGLVYLLIKLS